MDDKVWLGKKYIYVYCGNIAESTGKSTDNVAGYEFTETDYWAHGLESLRTVLLYVEISYREGRKLFIPQTSFLDVQY